MITTQNTTDNEPGEALNTVCANCGVKLYQNTDPNNIHWYHSGTGDVRCPTRFAEPSLAAVGEDARIERLEAQLNGVMNSLATSQQEVERLRAGRFTPEEFQNLCHGFDESDKEAFIAGCLEYQKKLFGCAAAASSAPAEPPLNHALVQLLEAALLHPESAEGNIRQVIETLGRADSELQSLRDENKRLRKHVTDLNHDLEAAIKECNEQHG